MKFHYFLFNCVIIFLLSKLYLKGYKFKPKNISSKNKFSKNNISNKSSTNITNDKYDYDSPYYYPHNLTCESLGISTWALLHSVAAIYSNRPNKTERESLKDFFDGLMYFYPSKSELMKEILKEHPLEYSNREELIYYMCEIHNILNRKLGKKKFSCKEAFNVWGGDCGCNE